MSEKVNYKTKKGNLSAVNKTLYIPLYGKAYVSQKGLFLQDPIAQKIWQEQAFKLSGKAKSKWLAYYMGIRSGTFDEWVRQKVSDFKSATVIHLGCGLDSRAQRINCQNTWYDVDFLQVIEQRQKHFIQTDNYKMLAADLSDTAWLNDIPKSSEIIVVMEGVSMYLTLEKLQNLTTAISERFDRVYLLVDCYSKLAAKLSKFKNPIKGVGVNKVYGLDEPEKLNANGLAFNAQLEITPQKYINELKGIEKAIFQRIYAGKFSKKLYKLYEFKK